MTKLHVFPAAIGKNMVCTTRTSTNPNMVDAVAGKSVDEAIAAWITVYGKTVGLTVKVHDKPPKPLSPSKGKLTNRALLRLATGTGGRRMTANQRAWCCLEIRKLERYSDVNHEAASSSELARRVLLARLTKSQENPWAR